MRKSGKNTIVVFIIAALILVPLGSTLWAAEASAQKAPSPESMVMDIVVLRPVGLCTTVAGFGFYVLSLPFQFVKTDDGSNVTEPWKQLVEEPAKFTFYRKVGDF